MTFILEGALYEMSVLTRYYIMEIFMLLLGAVLAATGVFLFGVYTVGPTERGVLTTFGRSRSW